MKAWFHHSHHCYAGLLMAFHLCCLRPGLPNDENPRLLLHFFSAQFSLPHLYVLLVFHHLQDLLSLKSLISLSNKKFRSKHLEACDNGGLSQGPKLLQLPVLPSSACAVFLTITTWEDIGKDVNKRHVSSEFVPF